MKYKTCCNCGGSAGKHGVVRVRRIYCRKCAIDKLYVDPDKGWHRKGRRRVMKFVITRSDKGYEELEDGSVRDEAQPHPKAVKKIRKVSRLDVRSCTSPEEFDQRFPGTPWLKTGKDHRVLESGPFKGCIVRTLKPQKVTRWEVTVGTLKDLVAMMDETGHRFVIGREQDTTERALTLEIYDGRRE